MTRLGIFNANNDRFAAVEPDKLEETRSGLRSTIGSLAGAGKSVHVRLHDMDSGLTKDDLIDPGP